MLIVQDLPGKDRISTLEYRYIELLESKIAHLESQLAKNSTKEPREDVKVSANYVQTNARLSFDVMLNVPPTCL